MQVLVPIPITSAMIVSSTASETYEAWDIGATYAKEARAIEGDSIYESLIDGNTGKRPSESPNQWLRFAPTNKMAMFDREIATQTVADSPLTVVLRPGAFNSIGLYGLDAAHLVVSVLDAPDGSEVFHYEASLDDSDISDYWEYFFSPYRPQSSAVVTDVPTYMNAEVHVTLTSGGPVRVGALLLGDMRTLGQTLYGARARPKDYSYVDIDKYGNNTVIKGKAAKDIEITAWLKLAEANTVMDTLTELMGVPCAWFPTTDSEYAGLNAYGLGSGEISYDHPRDCLLSLTVQGLI